MRIVTDEFDKFFLSYGRILYKFKILNIKTKNGKEIAHKDLIKAVSVMLKKNPTCRWRSEKILSRRYYTRRLLMANICIFSDRKETNRC